MTIRTARLPRAGNLLDRAGEDLSGLPDRASCYQFFFSFFIDSIIYFNSSTRFRVTVAVFVLRFHLSEANQKLALFTRGEVWLALS